ncbi:hypothetical protein SAMD00019534_062730, partial [Acytostelium subglobosum LB1]|uniref:hypothetical protein n=1 Tax=Acytostelium subglobosum LB1 TaxID=1410327 RepID=UPI000644EA96
AYHKKYAAMVRNNAVREAFYWWCQDYKKDTFEFDCTKLPQSALEEGMTIDHMPMIIKFIKDKYVLTNAKFDRIKVVNLLSEFKEHHRYDRSLPKDEDTRSLLANYDFKIGTYGNGGCLHLMMNYEELLELYKSKKLISDLDEFQNDIDESLLDFSTDNQLEQKLIEQNKRLIERNKMLSEKLAIKEMIFKGINQIRIWNELESESEDEPCRSDTKLSRPIPMFGDSDDEGEYLPQCPDNGPKTKVSDDDYQSHMKDIASKY